MSEQEAGMRRTRFHHTGCLVSAVTLVLLAMVTAAGAQDSRQEQRAREIERSVAPDGLLSQQELRQRAEDRSAGEDRETVARKRLVRELMSRDPEITGSIQRPRFSTSGSVVRSAIATPPPARTIVE